MNGLTDQGNSHNQLTEKDKSDEDGLTVEEFHRLQTIMYFLFKPKINQEEQQVTENPEKEDVNNISYKEAIFFITKKRIKEILCCKQSSLPTEILVLDRPSTITLLLQDPSDKDSHSDSNKILDKIQVFFVSCFILELVLKLIAMGCVFHRNSYLRDFWNWIDFIVVIFGILELTPIPSVSLKPLRAFRILRPLKTIKAFPAMRKLVTGMISSIPSLLSALFFMVFVMTQFAILGTSLFSGDYYMRCRTTNVTVDGIWPYDKTEDRLCSKDPTFGYQCADGLICGNPQMVGLPDSSDNIQNMKYIDYGFTNFDNLLTSLATIFQVITKGGWTAIMYNLMDAESSWIVCMYFISLVVLGAFFLLQLVVAILSNSLSNFQEVEKNEDYVKAQNIQMSVRRKQCQIQGKELNKFNEQLQNTFLKQQEVNNQVSSSTDEQKNNVEQKVSEESSSSESSSNESSSSGLSQSSDSLQSQSSYNQKTNKSLQPIPKQKDNNIKDLELGKVELNYSEPQSQQDKDNKVEVKLQEEFKQNKQVQSKIPQRALDNRFYYFFYCICTHQIFSMLVAVLIFVNYIILCVDRFFIQQQEAQALAIINVVITCFFLVEMIIRLIGVGIKKYCEDYFNILDSLIVCISITDIVIYYTSAQETKLLLTAFRSVRILRILKMAREWTSFRILLQQVIASFKDIFNFSVLMSIFIIIFMVLGMQFFAQNVYFDANSHVVSSAELGTPPTRNFDDILNAFTTVFCIMIGDSWNNIMYEFMRVYGASAQAFFIILTIITNILLLNLLLAILFEEFEVELEEDNDSDIGGFEQLRLEFQVILKKIRCKQVQNPIELQKNNKESEEQELMKKYVQDLENLKQDKSNNQVMKAMIPAIQNLLLRKKSSVVSIASADLESFKDTNLQKVDLEGRSLFLFVPANKFRVFCSKITSWRYFDSVSLIVILISTINLAIYNPLNDPDSKLSIANYYIDIVVVGLFFLEALLLIIVNGFVINGKKSYLKQGWNVIDFAVVLVSIVSIAFPNMSQSKISKTLRFTFRLLRPLRMIKKNPGLKLIVESFIYMIPNVINLTIVTYVVLSSFAILGVNFFKGQFYTCQMDNIQSEQKIKLQTYWDCLDHGGEWINKDFNYDNILEGLKTQFIVMTSGGWLVIYDQALEGHNYYVVNKNAERNVVTLIFFVVSLLITSLFILNLYIGVVLSSFMIEQEKLERGTLLTKLETEYIDACFLCYQSKPIISYKPSGWCLKDSLHKIVVSKPFEYLSFACVLVNFLVLMLYWYGADKTQIKVLEVFNDVLTLIFTIEFLMKIIGLGCNGYFNNSWNILDFICTVISWIDFLIGIIASSSFVSSFKIVRIFRVFRFVKLISQLRDQKIIMMTFFNALPELFNVGAVLLLFLFLYAILGVHLFATVKLQSNLNFQANFQNLFISLLTLIRVSTGEGWNFIMEDTARKRSIHFMCKDDQSYHEMQQNGIQGCGSTYMAYIYFHSFILLINFILLNNFIAIILAAFERQKQIDTYLLQQQTIDEFCNHWTKYDPDATGFIEIKDLENLIISLLQRELEINEQNQRFQKNEQNCNILFNLHKSKMLTLSSQKKSIKEKNLLSSQMNEILVVQFKRFMGSLHIPTYNRMKHYYFHDVLQSFIQNMFSQRFKQAYLQRQLKIKTFKEKGQQLDQFDNITPQSPEYQALNVRDRLRLDELDYPEFTYVIFMLEQRNQWVDGQILNLKQMQQMRRKLRQKNKKQIDDFQGNLIDSSKVVSTLMIQSYFRKRKLAAEQKRKNKDVSQKLSSDSSFTFDSLDSSSQMTIYPLYPPTLFVKGYNNIDNSESELFYEDQKTVAVNKSNDFKFQKLDYKQQHEK